MISRYLVIALALGAAFMRFSQGAAIEAIGLLGLAGGLLCLKLAETRPVFKRGARLGFAITALAMGVALFRMWQAR